MAHSETCGNWGLPQGLDSCLLSPAVWGNTLEWKEEPISTAQMVTFLEAGCVHEATPLRVYLQWHPARACHSGTWYLVNCQLRAAQHCGLLGERKDLAAKGHCLTSCSPRHTVDTLSGCSGMSQLLSETCTEITTANNVGRYQSSDHMPGLGPHRDSKAAQWFPGSQGTD